MIPVTTFWAVLTIAILAAGGFSFLEWQRANRLHLAARLAATFLAITALALLGLHPTWRQVEPVPVGGMHAVLWTPLAFSTSPAAILDLPGIDAQHRFALPDAASLDPAAKPVPDPAFLRRRFPEIGTLKIVGGGLDPSELDALRGLRVEFDPPKSAPGVPGLSFLHCPRELSLGDPLIVQGQLGGLAANTSVTLTLEAPDGNATNARHLPPPTPPARPVSRSGPRRYPLPDTLHGGCVRPLSPDARPSTSLWASPSLRRTCPGCWSSKPRRASTTAALRRWFEAAGGTLIARTQVGQDRYQFTSAVATPTRAVHRARRALPRQLRPRPRRHAFPHGPAAC